MPARAGAPQGRVGAGKRPKTYEFRSYPPPKKTIIIINRSDPEVVCWPSGVLEAWGAKAK